MHMSDALLTPAVGGAFWVASAGIMAYAAKKNREEDDESSVPLMGVMSAFVFAAQMVNISIPGTGSSGHLGGGLLLAIFLGPHRAFISIASILTVQCLFFADGGLLALGANVFNIGFMGAYIGYLLVWKPLAGDRSSYPRLAAATVIAGIITLQFGALSVVLQTVFSGISELGFSTFVLFMLPIHLAIGIVEGLVTLGILGFIQKMRPEIFMSSSLSPSINLSSQKFSIMPPVESAGHRSKGGNSAQSARRSALYIFLSAAILTGGFISWYASSSPDGLEWSVMKTSGQEEFEAGGQGIRGILSMVVEKLAFLPDYAFKNGGDSTSGVKAASERAGTSLAGIIGVLFVLTLAAGLGFAFRRKNTAGPGVKKTA